MILHPLPVHPEFQRNRVKVFLVLRQIQKNFHLIPNDHLQVEFTIIPTTQFLHICQSMVSTDQIQNVHIDNVMLSNITLNSHRFLRILYILNIYKYKILNEAFKTTT